MVLSTDCEEIAEVGRACGVDVPFMRPAELATDAARSIDVVLHAIKELPGYDAVMLLQPTNPLRTVDDIDGAIELLGGMKANSVISVTACDDFHPGRLKLIDEAGWIHNHRWAEESEGVPRQQLPPVWLRCGNIYLATVEQLKREKRFQGKRCRSLVIPRERSINIDSELDLWICEAIVSRLNLPKPTDIANPRLSG